MDKTKLCSIIFVHYHKDEKRSEQMMASMNSLVETTKSYPCEIVVVDNGQNEQDSQFFLSLVVGGAIQTYVRNANNMHFGYARNQGMVLSNGDYICISDNDIIYTPGWLEACVAVLEKYPHKKIYATPVYNVAHWLPKFWHDEVLEVGDRAYRLNSRAGSNCFVIRRKDLKEIGGFLCHRVAGTKWTEKAIRLEFAVAVTPDVMVDDVGFRDGYNYKEAIPIKEILTNGKEVYFNEDEFKHNNRRLHYIQQSAFDIGNNPRS